MRRIASWFIVGVAATGCVLPSQRISPHGRTTMLHTSNYRLNGELIAVTPDTVWLLTRHDSTLVPVGRPSIVRLDVQRHQLGGMRTLQLMTLAGTATGLLLTVACSSVDDNSCGLILPGTVISFAGIGALFATFNFESAWMKHEPGELARARAYSRFPQGLPDTVRTTLRRNKP